MKRLKHVIVAAALAAAGQAAALDWRDSPEVGALFRAQGVEGTFVLYDAAAERYVGHDRERAERRLVPASTFKIPHTLIGLSVGAGAMSTKCCPTAAGRSGSSSGSRT